MLKKTVLELFADYLNTPDMWKKIELGQETIYYYEFDPNFSIIIKDNPYSQKDIKEPYSENFCDKTCCFYEAYLKYNSTIVHTPIACVTLDGGRNIITTPYPTSNNEYYKNKNSLKYKLDLLFDKLDNELKINEILSKANIKLKDN